MGLRKRFKDFRDWCPQPTDRLATKLKRHFMPIVVVVTATLVLSVSFIALSSSLMSNPALPVLPIVGPIPISPYFPSLLWNYSTGHSVFSPVVSGDVVYFGTSGSNLYALNANNGKQLWNYSSYQETSLAPVLAVADDAVYVGGFNNVFAINTKNGATLWDASYGEDARYFASPIVVSGVVYTGAEEGGFSAFNAKSGVQLWNYLYDNQSAGGVYVSSSAAFANGKVYFAASNQLYALNAATGAKLWNYSLGDLGSTPAVANGVVYVGTGALNTGIVYALNATSGAEIWSFTADTAIYSSPAVADGTVYINSISGTQFALNARTGAELWNNTYAVIAGYGALTSSPIVYDNFVYVGSTNGDVNALNATTGNELWSYHVENSSLTSPAISNGILYVGSANGNVYALRVSAPTPSPTPSPSFVSSNSLLIITGVLVAVIVVAAAVIIIKKPKKGE